MQSERLMIVSSDGHAGALMADYRPYLDPEFRAEFDDFVVEWNKHGSRNIDPPALQNRLDPESIEEWNESMVRTGRLDGYVNPTARLRDVGAEGICAEVLFPDFGLPFELYSASHAAALGFPPLDDAHRAAGYRAFNRWLGDYMSVDPRRFAGMAPISWHDVDAAVREIDEVHAAGFKGIVLPAFAKNRPLYHPDFEPIWNRLEELGMVVNSHSAFSSTSDEPLYAPAVPHPALALRLYVPQLLFYCHFILQHLIWGGVLERHPSLKVAFTEQHSDWVVPELQAMDFAYEGSFFRTDYKSVIRHKPSEYFRRQCFLGSSTFSRAEVAGRDVIGVEKMMIGMDYPHHEGTMLHSTAEYLRATFGAAHVGMDDARKMLGETAIDVFGFDRAYLRSVADRVGLPAETALAEPVEDLYPLGDVHMPAAWDVA